MTRGLVVVLPADFLFQAMRRALAQENVWSSQAFLEAKVAEQQARHHRFHDTAYNLEPNVKASPGGLRDIQTIGWVAKRHFGAETFDELVSHGFLTASELRKLRQAHLRLGRKQASGGQEGDEETIHARHNAEGREEYPGLGRCRLNC